MNVRGHGCCQVRRRIAVGRGLPVSLAEEQHCRGVVFRQGSAQSQGRRRCKVRVARHGYRIILQRDQIALLRIAGVDRQIGKVGIGKQLRGDVDESGMIHVIGKRQAAEIAVGQVADIGMLEIVVAVPFEDHVVVERVETSSHAKTSGAGIVNHSQRASR